MDNNKNSQSTAAATVQKIMVITPERVESAEIDTWRNAVNSAKRGNRVALYNLYGNLLSDPVLSEAMDSRIEAITNAEITFQVDGKNVEEIDDLIDTPEFEELIKEIAMQKAWGKSVIDVKFTPEFEVFSFPRKNIRIRGMERPRNEWKKFIAVKEGDNEGYDYTTDEFIIECGKDDDLGYLWRAAQYVIYKRGNFGDWAQFAELFGMPFLVGKYNGYDEKTQEMLYDAMSKIGGKPYAAIPKEADIEVHENKSSGSSELYQSLRRACNEEILIAIKGNTMTTLDGSSRAQGEVHEDTEAGKTRSDRRFVQRILNRHLVPMLVRRGYPAEGGFFLFPDAEEQVTTKERVDMALNLRREGIPVDDQYFYEVTGIPAVEKGKKEPEEPKPKEEPEPEPPVKPKSQKLADDERSWYMRLVDFFVDAPTTRSGATQNFIGRLTSSITGTAINLADRVNLGVDIDALFARALENIYREATGSEAPAVDPSLFAITNDALQRGIDKSFRSAGAEFGKKNAAFIAEFKKNAAVFSAFKNHQQGREIAEQLLDADANLRSFDAFRKAVMGTSISADYNRNWLRTEYNMAVRAARNAAKFKKYLETKHLYPNLEYLPSTAATPREQHIPFYHVVLPIEHPWWNTHIPPLDWGCECGIGNTDKPVTVVPGDDVPVDPVLANNPAKTAEFINIAEHPYVKGVCSVYESCEVRKSLLLIDAPNRPECRICLITQELYRNIEARRQRYEAFDDEEWERVFFDKKKGGYLVINRGRITQSAKSKAELLKFEKERAMSRNFAKNGHSIEMLLEGSRDSSCDVRFNGILGDLKKTVGHNNIKRYAVEAVREKKAEVLLFEFEVETRKVHQELEKLKSRYNIRVYYYFTGREDKLYRNF